MTDLNRKLFRRVYERLMPLAWQGDSCLIVMGSEGRGEQLLRTDQDNGIIYREEPDAATRESFAWKPILTSDMPTGRPAAATPRRAWQAVEVPGRTFLAFAEVRA